MNAIHDITVGIDEPCAGREERAYSRPDGKGNVTAKPVAANAVLDMAGGVALQCELWAATMAWMDLP